MNVFFLGLLLIFLNSTEAIDSLPLSCARSVNGSNSPNHKYTVFRKASISIEDNPDHQICLLNVPASEYCQFWRVTVIILLKDDNEAERKTTDIVNFLKTVIEYCTAQSELMMFTPSDQNELCLEYEFGSDAQKDYLDRLSSADTTLDSNQLPGVVLENIFNRLKNCTDNEPFKAEEAGAFFIFTDFFCEELCEQSNLGAMVSSLLFNLTYNNKYVIRMYFLGDYSTYEMDCLNFLFSSCSLQQKQICDIRFYNDSSELETRANSSHTCEEPKEKISTLGLVLAISIPCLVLTLIVLILAIICIRHRLKKKWFSFWFEHTRQKAYSEERETTDSINNDYMDIERLQETRIKDLWEIDPDNLEINLGGLLGSGAFASVYKGRLTGTIPLLNIHSTLNVQIEGRQGSVYDVAVKKLPNHADDVARADFQHEMDFMKNLGYHLHIISLIGCVTSKIQPLIVVEYAHHGDLLKFLRTHRQHFISEKRASVPVNAEMSLMLKDLISFSWQISDGMVFLSSNKYIHRDLAARNIFLTKNLVAKVCSLMKCISNQIGDFGLCRELDTMLYTTRGGRLPIKWLAPESLRYYEYSSKSDVWAFGVLLFELFSLGEVPYSTVQPADMPDFLLQGNRLPKPDNCPDEIFELMAKCWEKTPDDRPGFIRIRENITKVLNSHDEQYGYLPIDLGQMAVVEEENDLREEEEKESSRL